MNIFIGHVSALQLLLLRGRPGSRVIGDRETGRFTATRAAPLQRCVPDTVFVERLGFPEGVLTKKLHVNVADHPSMNASRKLQIHCWPAPERGSYLRVDDVYCVQTPEACFAQMAGALPLPHLLELANMMCGSFAIQPHDKPTLYDVEPLTTPEKLSAYVARLDGKKGAKNARLAAKLASAGSESPMEAKIGAMLALPKRCGGMGIPAQQNAEIALTQEARGRGYRESRRPDFMWPRHKLAMDYESGEFHDAHERIMQDELRRNELASMSLRSIVARPEHFRDYLAFQQFMAQVLNAMGKADYDKQFLEKGKNAENRRTTFSQLFAPRDQFRPFDMQ